MTAFTVETYQNEYLPVGGGEVNAIVTVTHDGIGGPAGQPDAAEIVIVDTSGSMGAPGRKIQAAREATRVAIDCIRDGVLFGVIAGTDRASVVYPLKGKAKGAIMFNFFQYPELVGEAQDAFMRRYTAIVSDAVSGYRGAVAA